MLWLFAEEWFWMLLTTALGALLGWWLRGSSAARDRATWEANLAAARRSADDAAAGRTRLETQLAEANGKISAGAGALSSLSHQEAEKDKLQDGEIARLKTEVESLRRQLADAASSRTGLESELSASRTKIAAGVAAMAAITKQEADKDKVQDGDIARLKADLDMARRQASDGATARASLEKELADARARAAAGATSLSTLTQQEADKDKLQDGEIARLKADLETARKQLSDAASARSGLEADLTATKSRVSAGVASLAALTQQEADKDKIQDGEIARLKADLEACRRQHADKDAEIGKYRAFEADRNAKLPLFLDRPRGVPDDLKLIKGVGEKLNTLLTSLGIFHFRQIANWTADEIAQVDAKMENFKGRIVRDEWLPQAKLLADGNHTEFEAKYGKMGENN